MTLAWIVLISSAAFEAVWASALDASDGFRRLWPSIIFVIASIISLGGLAFALEEIDVGTAYAVWVGIGATLTAAWAMLTRKDRATVLRVCLLIALIGCVAGLKSVN